MSQTRKKTLRNSTQIYSDSVPLRTGQEIIDKEEWQAKQFTPGSILEYRTGDDMKRLQDLYGSAGMMRRQHDTHFRVITTTSDDIKYSDDTFSDYNKENPIWKFIKSALSNILITVLSGLGMYEDDKKSN